VLSPPSGAQEPNAVAWPAQNWVGKMYDIGRATVFLFVTPLLRAQNY